MISDSQVKDLFIGNFSVLSLPGGQVKHSYDYLPSTERCEKFVIFISGNNAFDNNIPSATRATLIAEQLKELGNLTAERYKKVYILGIPQRGTHCQRADEINKISTKLAEESKWKFLSLSKNIQFRHLKNHHVHLTSEGVNNIKNLIKYKILFKKYSKQLKNLGPERTFECYWLSVWTLRWKMTPPRLTACHQLTGWVRILFLSLPLSNVLFAWVKLRKTQWSAMYAQKKFIRPVSIAH